MGRARTITVLRYIAANIRRHRLGQGWTQATLAEAADMDLRHLQRVERAEVNLTAGALTAVADALGIPPAKLFVAAALPPARPGRPRMKPRPRLRSS